MLFDSLKLRLTYFSGHKNVKHLVERNVVARILKLQKLEKVSRVDYVLNRETFIMVFHTRRALSQV